MKPLRFAPGVIEHHARRRRWLSTERAAAIGHAALVLATWLSLAAVLGFTAGYLHVAGWLR